VNLTEKFLPVNQNLCSWLRYQRWGNFLLFGRVKV